MYLTMSYYISNAVVVLISLVLVMWSLIDNRYGDKQFNTRRHYLCMIALILAAHKFSMQYAMDEDMVELLPTQALSLLTIDFLVLVMGGCAIMGRYHHRTMANWIVLMWAPAMMLLSNVLMMSHGFYQPLYTMEQFAEYRVQVPIVFSGRVIFLTFMSLSWLVAIAMLVEAYVHDRWLQSNRSREQYDIRHSLMVWVVLLWATMFHIGMIPMWVPSLYVHIVVNVIYVAALVLTAIGYNKYISVQRALNEGRMGHVLIAQRLPRLLQMEGGGRTPWNIDLEINPFYSGNPRLDDVAAALGVKRQDITNYLNEHNLNLVGWVSEQRLLHCAQQITDSGRKIAEVALACGYNDLPSFSRAFKRQFGRTPTEYKAENGG